MHNLLGSNCIIKEVFVFKELELQLSQCSGLTEKKTPYKKFELVR